MRRAKRLLWPPPGGPYRDDRLAFLVAEPQLRRKAGRGSALLAVLLGLQLGGSNLSCGVYSGRTRGRMLPLAMACDEVAKKLDALERQQLREAGKLPDWFIPEVQRLAPSFRATGWS